MSPNPQMLANPNSDRASFAYEPKNWI